MVKQHIIAVRKCASRVLSTLVCLVVFAHVVSSQSVGQTILDNIKFTGDFRFRIEQDWNSRKADGTLRDNKSRLRYRMRFGASYTHQEWATLGFRLRTGPLDDQQDPHFTIGDKGGEYSPLQVGFEKLYFEANHKWLKAWVGKNTFPFFKHDEMFWNDNVFPEGVAAQFSFSYDSSIVSSLKFVTGYFIGIHSKKSFADDDFFTGIQVIPGFLDDQFSLPVAFYYFNRASNIPDGQGTYDIKYSIIHIAPTVRILSKPLLTIGGDFYGNVADLDKIDEIPSGFEDQKQGFAFNIKLGELKKKGDWLFHAYYVFLRKYSIVDYYAQNDWARWDYSGYDAKGSRLSNMKGLELRAGYAFGKKFTLICRSFFAEQILAEGQFTETGSRIRLDLDIGF